MANKQVKWIDLSKEDDQEKWVIAKKYQVSEEFFAYALDEDESARMEEDYENGHKLIIADIPFKDSSDIAYYSSGPMSFIVTPECVLTNFSNELMAEEFSLENRERYYSDDQDVVTFILNWLLMFSKKYLINIRQLNKERANIEKVLGSNPKNEDLLELMKIERSLIYFILSLKSNYLVMKEIRKGKFFSLNEVSEELVEDVMIEIEQGIDMSELSNRILNELTDSYSSIISNNMNGVMKFLTSYSIILTIPTIIFSFYGMNVPLPFASQSSLSWIVVTGIALLASIVFVWVFGRKKYF